MERTTILGSSKPEIDKLLSDWAWRADRLSTQLIRIYRYSQRDVTLIIHVEKRQAVGVAVIDNPGYGFNGIPQSRFDQLVSLIGKQPKPQDVKRDANGIREFAVGKTDYGK